MIEEELLVTIAFAFYLANLITVSFYLYRFQNTLADLVHNAREHRDTFNEQNIDDHRVECKSVRAYLASSTAGALSLTQPNTTLYDNSLDSRRTAYSMLSPSKG